MEYLTGTTGGKSEYLIIAENGEVSLGLKPTIGSWGEVHVAIKLRAANKDGELLRQALYTEAFPKIEFDAVNDKRASRAFSRLLNCGTNQAKMLTPAQIKPVIMDLFKFLHTLDVVPDKKGETALIEHLNRFWAVDPDFSLDFADEGWLPPEKPDVPDEVDQGDGEPQADGESE